MKTKLYLAFQIVLLAIAGTLLIFEGTTLYILLGVLLIINAFAKFVPLYNEFKGRKVFNKLTEEE